MSFSFLISILTANKVLSLDDRIYFFIFLLLSRLEASFSFLPREALSSSIMCNC